MPKSYVVCTDVITPIHDFILSEYRADLATSGVRVGYRFVLTTGKAKGPPLKLHGWPCAAIVKITTLEQRQFGMPDALVDIDGNKWKGMTDRRRQALIHHELEHLQPVWLTDDEVKIDDAARPVLKMKPHTIELGVFEKTIQIYGDDSIDMANINAAKEMFLQKTMPWG